MTKHHKKKHHLSAEKADRFRENFDNATAITPPGPTADIYRIAGYADGIVGASPECDILRPHMDSGLRWPDENNPKPDDPCWGRGIAGGVRWDGMLYRDVNRFPAGGQLFWCAYFKPGTSAGSKNGFWINFGSGWCHLANDNPADVLAGAALRLSYEGATGQWKLVIQGTMFVTYAVVEVWTGIKQGGNDPAGTYTRTGGCDPLAMLTVAAA